MNILVCEQPGQLAYALKEKPVPEKDRAILQVKRIGICGTDLHAFEGTQPFFSYPRVLGHELACVVEQIEPGNGFAAGDKVSIIPYFHCGHCIACRNGLFNCCSSISVFGVHADGGMCEYISVPVKYLLKGNDLGLDELALVEPLAIGAHAVHRAAIRPGEFVLVIGAGPIGLGTMEMARIAGAQVIAMDVQEGRLAFCREKLQIPFSIQAREKDVNDTLRQITGNDMPTVVIDATGNRHAINNALQYLAHGGRYVLVGLQKEAFQFSHPEFHKRETTLMSSRNATREDFEWVMQCMREQRINPANYITHRVPFAALKEHFTGWLDAGSGVIKAMVEL